MRVRFWGTRGSIATPGPGTMHFGGNTSCVELTTTAGDRLIFDCGTGVRALGAALMATAPKPMQVHMLLGHTHWDHIQGFPFFAPIFVPGTTIAVYAPEGEGSYEVGSTRVRTQYLNHPAVTLGYRVEVEGRVVVYVTDHEPFADQLWRADAAPGHLAAILHEGDHRHALFMHGADLVIHDAQYTPEEYPAKKTWGHSPFDYVVEIAAAAGVRRVALTHHDPTHDDVFLAELEQRARALGARRDAALEVFCAYEGCEVVLQPTAAHRATESDTAAQSAPPTHAARILVVDDDPLLRRLVVHTLTREGHTVAEAGDGREALRRLQSQPFDLLVLDLAMPDLTGLEVLHAVRQQGTTHHLPVLILTAADDAHSTQAGFDAGANDYLTKPFAVPQLLARVHACLARTVQG